MRIEIAPEMAAACHRAEAEARGLTQRLDALARIREDDGLDALDAELDAAASLGLVAELASRLVASAEPLESCGLDTLVLEDAHAGMPTLRRDPPLARFQHDPAPFAVIAENLSQLVPRLVEDEERSVAMLAVGLGGTGGCATGECLPEDAPPGPLFERTAR